MSGPESVLPPGASSGMSDILLRTSCYKISLPLRNASGEATPIRGLQIHTSGTVLKHVLGADANLVARLCRALLRGGRSQSSGLTNFPISIK